MHKNVRKTKVYGAEKRHRLRDQKKAIKRIDKILNDMKRFWKRSASEAEKKMWEKTYVMIDNAKRHIGVWS